MNRMNTDLLTELKNTLSNNKRFVAENGELIKASITSASMQLEPEFISLLLSNENIKDVFFREIDNVLVFDKVKFNWVVNNKKFLPNSYTKYKNKIGLSSNDYDLITENKDVSLVWPYKDNVLEGGQTKEKQEKNEVFYNEILAPQQIRSLLAPKAVTNAKRYSPNKVEDISNIGETDNLIIKGNNLLALHSLKIEYSDKVKLIIIDPPYYFNKNKSVDTFNYNSNFKLSTWLTFMKNRLEVARELLRENGIISIIIGEDGYAHLRLLCDEIFGKDNYINTIAWRKTDNQSNIGEFANVKDYILLYKKSNLAKVGRLPLSEKAQKEYSYEDDKGRYRRANIMDQTRGKYEYDIKTPNGNVLSGPWMITENEFSDLLERDAVHWPDGGEQIPYGKTYLVDQMEKGQISSDFWDSNYGTNQRGATEMKALFGDRAFDFPKPEKLLYNLINIGSKPGDLVLDFFMGSATTQAAAHKMGRQYIGIEQMEYINTLSVPRLQKVIEGEQGGISKEVAWQGGGDFVYLELKELNEKFVQQIYSIDDINGLKNIYKKLKNKGLLVPSLETKEIEKENSFDEFSLGQQKDIILSSIDKNKLYVNASQIDDKEIGLTEYEKTLTNNFYGKEEFDDRKQGTLSI